MAPWVPIGVEAGLGKRKGRFLGIRSIGLFVHALDLGALAAYRVKKGAVDSRPEVSFKQIVSPGIFLVGGFRNAPLSFAIGASYAPQLRTVTDVATQQETKANALRLGLSFALDIPLFP